MKLDMEFDRRAANVLRAGVPPKLVASLTRTLERGARPADLRRVIRRHVRTQTGRPAEQSLAFLAVDAWLDAWETMHQNHDDPQHHGGPHADH